MYLRADHIDDIFPTILAECLGSNGVSGTKGGIKEVVGAHLVLDGAIQQFSLNPRRRLSPIYASAEILWYLSRQADGAMICAYAPQYKQYLDEDGTAFGGYGERIWDKERQNLLTDAHDQLIMAADFLKKKIYSKRCIVSLWRSTDLKQAAYRLHEDIPCTLTWQFLVRDGKLNMIVNMRSNDAWLGLPYDVHAFTTIQRWMASELSMSAGEYHHITGSMHVYEKNFDAARETIEGTIEGTLFIKHDQYKHPHYAPNYNQSQWLDSELKRALSYEEILRKRQRIYISDKIASLVPVLRDLVECCRLKFQPQCREEITHNLYSPVLRYAVQHFVKEIQS